MVELDPKNIVFGLEADSRDDAIRKLCGVMERNGYLGPDYAGFVIERENKYPTGLPTEGVVTAIPHANKGTVLHTGIGMAILKHPVGFYNIADHSDLLQAELIFVLANVDPDKQLGDLQSLMGCFSHAELLREMRAAAAPEQVIEILGRMERQADGD